MLVLALQIALFAHLIWLGLYLTSRAGESRAARSIGGALAVLALALALSYYQTGEGSDISFGIVPLFMALGLLVGGAAELAGLVSSEPGRVRHPDVVVVATGFVPPLMIMLLTGEWQFGVHWAVLAVLATVFIAVGFVTAWRLARDRDEAFLPDITRSYDYSFLIAALFGGQVVLAMWAGPGATDTMVYLLLGTITAAVAIQVYLDRVQRLLDRIAFANVPWLRQERAELRRVENLLPRVNMTDPLTIEEDEFNRLTRRALGNFGDLTKLATSPLTNLPEVHRRLAARGVEPTTLERARELKVVLAEAIEQLKPRSGTPYGTTDEWRFYNALYYPYIIGIRPYSTTAVHSFDEPHHYEVLEWFRTYVPERTLYNWQNAAAALIASHLREQEEIAVSPADAQAPQLTTTG